jgi:hypothetical protein
MSSACVPRIRSVLCVTAVTALSAFACVGCDAERTDVSSASTVSQRASTRAKGVARIMIDVSNSFAPFDEQKARQIGIVLDAVATQVVGRANTPGEGNWFKGGVVSVHPIDGAGVTAAPLCPPIEYVPGSLLKPPSIDKAEFHKLLSACALLVRGRSNVPATNSDIRNAINMASFPTDPSAIHLLVIVSDFNDTKREPVKMVGLEGVSVLMIHGPEKTALDSNAYFERLGEWKRVFLQAGAVDVRQLQLSTLTHGDVLSQLPN